MPKGGTEKHRAVMRRPEVRQRISEALMGHPPTNLTGARGKKFSDQAKANISAGQKKRRAEEGYIPRTEEQRANITVARRAQQREPVSELKRQEASERMTRWWQEADTSQIRANLKAAGERARGKPHLNQRGPKNANWKGGVSQQNKTARQLDMQTVEYTTWRREVFERDNYTCQECGAVGVRLNADHIKPYATFPDFRYDVDNGRTLCEPCHRALPTHGMGALKFSPDKEEDAVA
jgi:hypothetical protein